MRSTKADHPVLVLKVLEQDGSEEMIRLAVSDDKPGNWEEPGFSVGLEFFSEAN